MNELEYFRNHYGMLHMKLLKELVEGKETKETRQRIKRCELELDILDNQIGE